MSKIDRRDFCNLMAAVSGSAAASGIASESVVGQRIEKEALSNGFPASDYTPFGYLDNPWHAWDLHPSGVLRSLPGIGFGWYYPAGPGGYFSYKQNSVYVLELSLGFEIGGKRFRSPRDFGLGQLSSPHHTKNVLSYAFTEEEIGIKSTFALVNENSFAVVVELNNESRSRQSIRVLAVVTYRLGSANWWGRDGLAGRFHEKMDSLQLRSFAAGPVCTITASSKPSAHFLSSREQEIDAWFEASNLSSQGTSYYPQPLHGGLRYDITVKANSRRQLLVVMARGANTQSGENAGAYRWVKRQLKSHANGPKTTRSGEQLRSSPVIGRSSGSTAGYTTLKLSA